MFLVKLCEGKKVRDPDSKKLLEMGKPLRIERISAYWKRREADKEVTIEKMSDQKVLSEKEVSEVFEEIKEKKKK